MAQKDYKTILQGMLTGFLAEEDPIKAMLEWLLRKLMRVELEAKAGAPKGKHSKERKTNYSGYRVRRLHTRVGTIYLVVPKVRQGGYIPFFVMERKRSEVALLSLVQEAFVNGVSTRKIEWLARSLGIEGISAYLIEYTEDRANENAYIKADKLGPVLEQELAQAAN
ncbi:MAG: transposase [Candidatus Aminicenantes bacterium]|nr:transposase [Candidatus Aminicenantes bacterium]